MKIQKTTNADGSFYSWLWECPGCGELHQCDSRWTWNGSHDAPTFTPSVLVTATRGEAHVPFVCHFFVTDGRVQFLADCTHPNAGKTLDLPEWS